MFTITSNIPMVCTSMYYINKAMETSHSDMRFLYVLNGSLLIKINSEQYTLTKDATIYIPAETSYQLVPNEPSLLLFACFHPFFLLSTIGFDYQYIECNTAKYPLNNPNPLNTYFANLTLAYIGNSKKNSCHLYAKAYEFLHYISSYYIKPSIALPSNMQKTEIKLLQLKSYMHDHYMHSISLPEAAEALNYTPPYLSSFVKKHLNMTFQDYLNSFRLEAAKLLLKYSDETNTKISLLCGFPNISSFIKVFTKTYHQSPEDYKDQYLPQQSNPDSSALIPITNAALSKDYIFNYMTTTDNTSALLEEKIFQSEKVHIQHRTSLLPYWNLIINLGNATDFDNASYRSHLIMMQKALSFQYGRCNGLLDLTNIYCFDKIKNYDFSKIFEIIDFLKSIHLKPFFELDNKPFHIYNEEEMEFSDYEVFLNTVQYDNFLFEMLPHFIETCIIRYGYSEVATWKFELWRRYNPTMTSLEPPSEYCDRFQKVSHIIKSQVPDTSIGGPGFNSYLSTQHFEELISALKNSTYIPDFISVYCFPFIPNNAEHSDKGYVTAQTPNLITQKICELKTVLASYDFDQLPFYITELSAYLSIGNYINDSTFPAVYILHQVIENYGKIDALAYWVATDISLNYQNSSDPLFGGNGIITKDGIPKASFYAYQFLKQLGDQLIAQGNNYIITTREDNSIQILTYHISNLNYNFANSPENQEILHYPYSAFEDVPPLDLRLNLHQIVSGSYRITETTLDLNHGNVLSSWEELDHIKSISSYDLEYLKHHSYPHVQIRQEYLSDHYSIQATLNHNEAKLFILTFIE